MSSNGGFADAFNPGTASTTNTSSRSASTVRSRTRRLISDDGDDNSIGNGGQPLSSGLSGRLTPDLSTTRSRGTTPSPFPSRGVSPLPMRHPSRGTDSPNKGRVNGNDATSDFLDVSWSSLQSLASSFLGSDIARPASNGSARTHVRKPSRPDPYQRNLSKTSSPAWGPSGTSTPEIGAGTKEERQAYVQAKKREALLLADTNTAPGRDTRHKRRDSTDQAVDSSIDPEQDEEALAYIHHVQSTDTITGVTIRYGCQPAIFRKANGFWPSDSIQSRKTVLLPVDACTVKGRPIREPVDLLSNEVSHESLEDMKGSSIAPIPSPDIQSSKGDTLKTAEEGDRIWKHESMVQIDGFPGPVEIGRVPRRALGFFPRTRRKSTSYTDSEPTSSVSGKQPVTATTTPSTSSPVESSFADSPRGRPRDSPGPSNSRPGARHQRQRSNVQLSGPGVGTLDRNTLAPGPALDGLSKFFAQHMPNLAPQPSRPNFQTNPSESNAASNNTTALDNIGGAFEGWVRKMTTRAKAGLNELQQPSPQSYQINGRGPMSQGMGDLIELNDGLEARSSSGLESQRKPDVDSTDSLRGQPSASATSRTRGTGRLRSNYSDDGFKND